MNRKGFTLIELLAVIIILGILMIIAIPSVTSYISDSRKNAYVDTAREIISGARNLVNDGKLEMFDTGTTYYIEASCIKTENGEAKSPYGEFTKAYVVVIYDGKGYEYYWTSVDDAGQGIKGIVKYDLLDSDYIESDLKDNDITTTRGVDGRSNIQVIDKAHDCKKTDSENAVSFVGGDGTDTGSIMYPTGKTKDTITTGDLIRIGTEEFYVVSNDSNRLILFARYNLKVGKNYNYNTHTVTTIPTNEPGYGIQSSEMHGLNDNDRTANGTVAFASTDYWTGKMGEGKQYPTSYVYDSNSLLYPYLENYKNYLKSFGVDPVVKLVDDEDTELYPFFRDSRFYGIICSTSFWTGNEYTVQGEPNYIGVHYYSNPPQNGLSGYRSSGFGIRPIVVLNNN